MTELPILFLWQLSYQKTYAQWDKSAYVPPIIGPIHLVTTEATILAVLDAIMKHERLGDVEDARIVGDVVFKGMIHNKYLPSEREAVEDTRPAVTTEDLAFGRITHAQIDGIADGTIRVIRSE